MSSAVARRYERELGGALLASVSRSFYLSLRVLPGPVRGPMSLSYLLARASDTIADASGAVADPRVRIELLDRLGRVVGGESDRSFLDEAKEMLGEGHAHAGERRLMRELDGCVRWLGEVPGDARVLIRDVLGLIFRGQRLDLERFELPGEKPRALATEEELDEYTYLVAGAVGEFWTGICDLLLSRPFSMDSEEMRERAIEFGKGLQLLNIIRDFPSDLSQGRCYLPVGERISGLSGEELLPIAREIMKPCREKLEAGRDYVAATRPVRLRFAASLPLAIAFRTWRKLEDADWREWETGVKIPRAEVKSLMRSLAWRSLRPSWTARFLDKLAP